MFSMEVDKIRKVFFITAAGFFTMEEGKDFMTEYQSKTSMINPAEYSLIVDGREVKASAQDVADQLKSMILLYMSVPFKKRIIIQQQSVIADNQTKRIAKDIPGFDTIIFAESIEDAYSKR